MSLEPAGDEARYQLGPMLGRGGMGEVRQAYDARFDRDVAIKVLRTDQRDEASVARFYQEARIQGRLDHPAIVPVHDLGVDRDGNPFLVMKRLTGTTLAAVLAAGTWPRRTLLARFVDVCLAIELAHQRGVIHRDLKPANIMLGDFGEAYVLDWGLARLGDDIIARLPTPLPDDVGLIHTVAGSIMGTPGYMAPEQISAARVDGRADVYALGCILFEIVAGKPALPPGGDAIEAALSAACLRPSERFADIPPELDDACAAATAAEPGRRPTARGLADRVQAYLDGDRDLESRRAIASTHAERAARATERAVAIREAGRALALDAENALAQQTLAGLLIDLPDAMPARALVTADLERAAARQVALRWMARTFLPFTVLMGTMFVGRVRDATPIVAMMAANTLTALSCWWGSLRPLPRDARPFRLALWSHAMTLAAGCLVFGPLFLMPMYLVASVVGALDERTTTSPWSVLAPYALAIVVPLALELAGVLPASFHIIHGSLVLAPPAIELDPVVGLGLELAGILSTTLLVSGLVLKQRRLHEAAQDRMHTHQWDLRQLVSPAP